MRVLFFFVGSHSLHSGRVREEAYHSLPIRRVRMGAYNCTTAVTIAANSTSRHSAPQQSPVYPRNRRQMSK